MQLFILDYDPVKSVEYLSDCHVIKMSLETSQILSSVIYNNDMEVGEWLPKPYNPYHPVIKAIDNAEKINWLLDYNQALHNEYYFRFNKRHAYFKIKDFYEILRNDKIFSFDRSKLDFARDFKDFETNENDLVQSFRGYYRFKKSIIKRWKYTNRIEPEWLT